MHKYKTPPFLLKNLTFRPIIGGKDTVLSGLSILLDKILQKITSFVPSRIKDSFDAIEKINDIDFSEFDLAPFDATSLYTNISLSLVHQMIDFWMNHSETKDLFPDRFKNGLLLHEGLEIIFTQNFFTFNGLIYLQNDGMAMGTNVAVSVADLSLGFLEIRAQIAPPKWFRFIDDGLFTMKKAPGSTFTVKPKLTQNQVEMLKILNDLDPKIFWTTEKIGKKCEFLDLAIDLNTGKISTFHKPTAALNNYVPWSSYHSFQTKKNLCFNFFYRARRINSTVKSFELECLKTEIALFSLGYPSKVIYGQKERAMKHTPKSIDAIDPAFSLKTMYFTSTRNEVTSGKQFHSHIKRVFEILKESPYFKRVVLKTSFRQPPSLGSSLIIENSSHKNPEPVKCKENACKVCPIFFTGKF